MNAAPDALPFSPAAERNRQPILDMLRRVLPAQGTALEIASGTGQHAVWFAQALAGWAWQPTEADAAGLDGLAARLAQEGPANVCAPQLLDVMQPHWLTPAADAQEPALFDAIFCANMLHISPWATCHALMQGSVRHLAPGGQLITYGPYLEDGVPTSPGNLAFDQSLRERNTTWGLRRLADVQTQARQAGLALKARHAMPANNLLLVFSRAP